MFNITYYPSKPFCVKYRITKNIYINLFIEEININIPSIIFDITKIASITYLIFKLNQKYNNITDLIAYDKILY